MLEQTLAILKPDCLRKNLTGEVMGRIEKAGFKIVAMKIVKLTSQAAREFYAVHKARSFYEDLVRFMSSGRCMPIALEKENAVEDFRAFMGTTNPKEAKEGTIRKLFADSIKENIVHGSDSLEVARSEIAFFFSGKELLESD